MQSNIESETSLFVIEGNIGAGKTTFLRILKENLAVDIIHEPTDKWQNVAGSGNLLDLFYKESKRWAYTFQSFAFITRVEAIVEKLKIANANVTQILERSVYSDRFCFAKNCYESGTMTALEWQIYKDWFKWLVESYTQKPTGFIYLKTDPKVCYERMVKRDRSEESAVPLDYLELLHKKHEDWLINKVDVIDYIKDVPVLSIDCNLEFENDMARQKELISLISSFIENVKYKKNPVFTKQNQVQL